MWMTLKVSSYKVFYSSEQQFRVTLTNAPNIATLSYTGPLPYIPETSTAPTVHVCGITDGTGAISSGSYVDISRLDIVSPVGSGYSEDGGNS